MLCGVELNGEAAIDTLGVEGFNDEDVKVVWSGPVDARLVFGRVEVEEWVFELWLSATIIENTAFNN